MATRLNAGRILGTVSILQLASLISTPLMLAGLLGMALFLVARTLVRRLGRGRGSEQFRQMLAGQVVDRLFRLAASAVILGFLAYLIRPTAPGESAAANAATIGDCNSSVNLAFWGKAECSTSRK